VVVAVPWRAVFALVPFEIGGVDGPNIVLHPPTRRNIERGLRGRQIHEDPE
jgi:hypothetical protein